MLAPCRSMFNLLNCELEIYGENFVIKWMEEFYFRTLKGGSEILIPGTRCLYSGVSVQHASVSAC